MPDDVSEFASRVGALEVHVSKIALEVSGLTRNLGRLVDVLPALRLGGGTVTFKENGRIETVGDCGHSNDTLISQTNDRSNTETIRYITNTGTCGDVTIRCLDSLGREVNGTAVVLKQGQTIRSYTTHIAAYSVVFSCAGRGAGEEGVTPVCKIEYDR